MKSATRNEVYTHKKSITQASKVLVRDLWRDLNLLIDEVAVIITEIRLEKSLFPSAVASDEMGKDFSVHSVGCACIKKFNFE